MLAEIGRVLSHRQNILIIQSQTWASCLQQILLSIISIGSHRETRVSAVRAFQLKYNRHWKPKSSVIVANEPAKILPKKTLSLLSWLGNQSAFCLRRRYYFCFSQYFAI
jgi:hypothetical protein